MVDKNTDMRAIFSKLSERNKDMIILVAKSVKFAQDSAEQPQQTPEKVQNNTYRTRHIPQRTS